MEVVTRYGWANRAECDREIKCRDGRVVNVNSAVLAARRLKPILEVYSWELTVLLYKYIYDLLPPREYGTLLLIYDTLKMSENGDNDRLICPLTDGLMQACGIIDQVGDIIEGWPLFPQELMSHLRTCITELSVKHADDVSLRAIRTLLSEKDERGPSAREMKPRRKRDASPLRRGSFPQRRDASPLRRGSFPQRRDASPVAEAKHDHRSPVEAKHDHRSPVAEAGHHHRSPVAEAGHHHRSPVEEAKHDHRSPVAEAGHDHRSPVEEAKHDHRSPAVAEAKHDHRSPVEQDMHSPAVEEAGHHHRSPAEQDIHSSAVMDAHRMFVISQKVPSDFGLLLELYRIAPSTYYQHLLNACSDPARFDEIVPHALTPEFSGAIDALIISWAKRIHEAQENCLSMIRTLPVERQRAIASTVSVAT